MTSKFSIGQRCPYCECFDCLLHNNNYFGRQIGWAKSNQGILDPKPDGDSEKKTRNKAIDGKRTKHLIIDNESLKIYNGRLL